MLLLLPDFYNGLKPLVGAVLVVFLVSKHDYLAALAPTPDQAYP
jgi:hypothetical protein